MKEQNNSKVPQIRFKGFEGDWEAKKLSELCDLFTDGDWIESKDQSVSGIRLLQTGNVGVNEFIDKADKARWISLDTFERLKCEEVFAGDILISRLPEPAGRACIVPKLPHRVITAVDCTIVRTTKNCDPSFLVQHCSLHSYFETVNNYLGGGTRQRISRSALGKFIVKIPKFEEQQKIGGYFRELDRLIGLHQRKHDKLVTLKKAMLQKMFPQQGATTPEIRFKGFSGQWAKRTLYHLTDRYDNLRIPVSASNRIPGNTPYYGANGIQDYVQGYTHEGEFILVAEDGANDLKNYPVQYVSGKVWVNNHAHVLQGKVDLAVTLFLKYAFAQINVEAFLVGGGRSKLNAETMMKMELYAPEDIMEQQKIGTYFRTLDELISKYATQMQKLRQIKSACLEKMFV